MAKDPSTNGTQTATGPATAAPSHSAATDSDDIRNQLNVLQRDLAQLTRVVGDYGRAKSDEFKTTARGRADALKGDAEARYRDAELQARQAWSEAEGKVRENPAAAVGIAAGFGFLVGLVMARR